MCLPSSHDVTHTPLLLPPFYSSATPFRSFASPLKCFERTIFITRKIREKTSFMKTNRKKIYGMQFYDCKLHLHQLLYGFQFHFCMLFVNSRESHVKCAHFSRKKLPLNFHFNHQMNVIPIITLYLFCNLNFLVARNVAVIHWNDFYNSNDLFSSALGWLLVGH